MGAPLRVDGLESAYKATLFEVDIRSRRCVIRIGNPIPPSLKDELGSRGIGTAAFITAWNPGSVPLGDAENAARGMALRKAVAETGLDSIPGQGVDPSGKWPPEESILVLGIAQARATRLAETFGQNAYVWLVIGEPAKLVFTAHWDADESS